MNTTLLNDYFVYHVGDIAQVDYIAILHSLSEVWELSDFAESALAARRRRGSKTLIKHCFFDNRFHS